MTVAPKSQTQRSETDLLVFISSVMSDDLNPARQIAEQAIRELEIGRPWAFEYTPASSESPSELYLSKVSKADFVVWLVGQKTTQPVVNEINECIASRGRLLVFKLPYEPRDAVTTSLLATVSTHVKWKETESEAVLGDHIKSALADELIRALRDHARPIRIRHLTTSRDHSRSEREESLKALGVKEDIASEIADDPNVGNVLDVSGSGLHVLVGPQGSGKTLAMHRLFQLAIDRNLKDSSEQYPVFINAGDIDGTLREVIDKESQRYADPSIQEILVLVDAIDDRGSRDGTMLLREMAAYVGATPRATLVGATRPLPGLEHSGTTIEMPTLEFEEAGDLIQRVSGRELGPLNPLYWRESVRDAAARPLFAIMIGVWLRENAGLDDVWGHSLVESMALRSLREGGSNSADTDRLLQNLAVAVTTLGMRVRASHVTASLAEQSELLDSRLVHQGEAGIDFALPIFREWYAARAILENAVETESLDLKTDRWTVPLSIVAHSEGGARANAVMEHLASNSLNTAAGVLKDDQSAWYWGGVRPAVPPNAAGVGERIRQTMEVWRSGLGPVFRIIGPVDAQDGLATLGVRMKGSVVTLAWYKGQITVNAVVEFDEEDDPSTKNDSEDWPSWLRMEIPPTPLWSWVITKDELVRNLSSALQDYRLSYDSDDAVRELAWEFCGAVSDNTGGGQAQIAVSDVLEKIEHVAVESRGWRCFGGTEYCCHEVDIVHNHLLKLRRMGNQVICDPWPISDAAVGDDSTWYGYSDQGLLERTRTVYAAALRIYETMVARWLQPFAEQLGLYGLLPVKLEGRLSTRNPDEGKGRPVLSWRPVVLSRSEQSHIDFELGTMGRTAEDMDRYYQEHSEAVALFRGGGPQRTTVFSTSLLMDKVVRSRAATRLAHEWLWDEMGALGWRE